MRMFGQPVTRSEIDCDICIVGAGPAGLATAIGLEDVARQGRRVLIVEAGGDYTTGGRAPPAQIMSSVGEVEGWLRTAPSDYLLSSRAGGLGGTTQVWAGWWWGLERRDIDGEFGDGHRWPLAYDELLPFLVQADSLGDHQTTESDDVGSKTWDPRLGIRCFEIEPRDAWSAWVANRRSSSHVEVITDATVTALERSTATDPAVLDALLVRTVTPARSSSEVRIRARAFVLAAGALESTRLLLLSGLGGPHVGRHLMEHPHVWDAARFVPTRRWWSSRACDLIQDDAPVGAAIVGHPTFLDDAGISGFRCVVSRAVDDRIAISLAWEQRPNPGSFVTLSERLRPDPFGRPRLRVQTMVSEFDRVTGEVALRTICDSLRELGLAEDVARPAEDDPWAWTTFGSVTPGYHPMGTTKMSTSPANGVVDTDCKVHGTTNLYVVGPSVFPTGGYANPTKTAVALALRLSSHLGANAR